MEIPTFTKQYHKDVYPAIDPSRPELSAAGKVVLITGGSQGIGHGIARAFAKAGASDIIITARRQDVLSAAKSHIESTPSNKSRVHTYTVDISDEARMNELFAEVVKKIGRIDIYVANAAHFPDQAPVATASLDDSWRGFEVNVKGAIIGAQAFLRSASDSVVLINITTGAAHLRYFGAISAYASSKLAVVRIMDAIAVENPHVRVYNLQPGAVKTEMSDKADLGQFNPNYDSADLPGAFSVWLASPEGEFLKGRLLWSNWDVEEMKAQKEAILQNPEFLTVNLVGFLDFKHKSPLF